MRVVAERATNRAAGVVLAVQMLLDVSPIREKMRNNRSYLVDVIPVFKIAIAGIAVEMLFDLVVA